MLEILPVKIACQFFTKRKVVRPELELKIPEQMIWRCYYWTESTILSVCGDYFYDFKA